MEQMGVQQKISENLVEHPVLLFDGVCNFCNQTVQFVIKRDKEGIVHFAPLQSTFGQSQLQKANLATHDLKTLIFIENGQLYTKSSGALKLSKYLGGVWKLAYILIFIPKPIRDFAYDFIAKNRYKWFGKKDECMLPSPEVRGRFIDS
ncbi:MAG: putative DCC family thiol-disulfide oxidoreductase YuxK [Maribacter sp.]|jgi:predicted DCC family thiol-disulfide oxidoreductase YuxK